MRRPVIVSIALLAAVLLAWCARPAGAATCPLLDLGWTCAQIEAAAESGFPIPDGCAAACASTPCPGFPGWLLTADALAEGELHALLVRELTLSWQPGEVVHDLYVDERRSFLADAAFGVLRGNPGITGSSENWLGAGAQAVYLRAAGCLGHLVVRRVARGDGSDVISLQPRSSSGAGGCSGFELSWLARQLRQGIPEAALEPFAEADRKGFSMQSANPEDDRERAEALSAIATMLRELGGEGAALEALRDLSVLVSEVGTDEEGGRP